MNNNHRPASVRDAVALYEERHKATFNPKAALIDMDGTLLDTIKGTRSHGTVWPPNLASRPHATSFTSTRG